MSTTLWNWSWVSATNNTLKSSESIDQSGGTLYTYRAANRGQLDASDISTSIDSISTNINQQWTLWRTHVRPILDSLPAGERDQRWRPGIGLPTKIDALTYGLQGTTLFVFNDATSLNAYGKYWHTADERPLTIAEAMENVWTAIADIVTGSFNDTDLWLAIGNRYEDGTSTSAATSLDARADELEDNDEQLTDDLYGEADGFVTYDWGTPLLYSVAKNIDLLLKQHEIVGGWQANPATASHATLLSYHENLRRFTGMTAYTSGSETPTYSSTNYVTTGTSLETAIGALDSGVNAVNAIFGILQEPTGFVNHIDSTLSFVAATRTFTITPAGTFDYYYHGNKITVSVPRNVVIADTNGVHYIYYNAAGVLTTSMVVNDLKNTVPVAIVLWNTDLAAGVGVGRIAEERHGCIMDWRVHEYLHDTVGTHYHNGLGLTGYTLLTDSDAAVQFGVSDGEVYDEDMVIDITHAAAPSSDFEQILTDPAEVPVFYRTGASGEWIWDAATTFAFKNTAAGRVNYNQYTGGAWQQTQCTDNYYVAYWIVATTGTTEPIISMQGQREDQLLVNAIANNTITSVDFGNLPFAEMKILYRVILRSKTTFGGTWKAKIADITDFRSSNQTELGSAYVPVYHGALGGLTNDDHFQYALLAGRTGGQILYGGIDASDDLDLYSTSHGTPGTIILRDPVVAYDTISGNTVLSFSDSYNAGSTWAQLYMTFSESTAEWDAFEIPFGEVSLLSAITKAGTNTYLSTALADTTAEGTKIKITNNAAVTFGQAILLDASSEGILTDADAVATMPCRALAIDAGAGAAKEILLCGVMRDDSWSWNPGESLYVSPTAGDLQQTVPSVAGQYAQAVGFAITATIIYFNPSGYMHEVG